MKLGKTGVSLKALAFAKLNLTLEVLGRRSDGYHEVSSILQTIDLADNLEILPAPALQVECDDPSLNGQANLVWHAAVSLARQSNTQPQAHIYIQKHIPKGMGLGGGSSDAACALVALNRLWGLDLTTEDLAGVASGLGSDVPFFLQNGTALVQGRGERVRRLANAKLGWIILLSPPIHLTSKTANLYSLLSSDYFTKGLLTHKLAGRIKSGGDVR